MDLSLEQHPAHIAMAMFRIIYSDVGYRVRVNNWNAVDVRRPDGVMQHGTVIGIESTGLLVDFGCRGQRRQLVPYGAAYDEWESTSHPHEEFTPGRVLPVLLRDDAQSPWTWRPATLVTADLPRPNTSALALVDVQLSGVLHREIVRFQQVRPMPSPVDLENHVIHQKDFKLASIRLLSADIAALLPMHSPRWKIFCQELSWNATPMAVNSDELVVLGPARLLDGAGLEMSVRRALERTDAVMDKGVMWLQQGWRCRLPCGPVEESENTVGSEWNLQDMHRLVLEEMFTYLDTMERVRLRRVCHAFDDEIPGSLSSEIRVTYRECSLGEDRPCDNCHELVDYHVQAPLLYCVTSHTRRIVLTGVSRSSGTTIIRIRICHLLTTLQTLEICGQLGQCVAGQEVTVAAGHCTVGGDERMGAFSFSQIADALAAAMAGGWCKRLLLKDYTLPSCYPKLRFSGAMRGLRFSGSLSATKADFWRAVEGQLPEFKVQRVAEWVEQALHDQSELWDISLVLRQFTSPDPRPSNVYADCDWSDNDLFALDLAKLSRIALYELNRLVPAEVP